ncbi:MAG TPA: tetratricopeptide repeat protein, partial [Planctomycetota bacterium]|nr:tetratricopeptide repeat protein [Planctomycetota bacterium]
MAMALLLTLLLPVLQDDPQVTYREGLFEEVDQGNLEKAAELYGKILKSGAPDALKAKALLRTGVCHEKKGRKKEAEQAWRDVIERYPSADSVKIARERLAQLSQEGSPISASLESQIQALALDLTSDKWDQKNIAVRKLVAIGKPSVPELRKALLSKSHEWRSTAAYVLSEIGEYEGIYDSLKPLWIKTGDLQGWAAHALGETLKAREEDRRKFLQDLRPEVSANLIYNISRYLCTIPDPAFPKLVEDWLVDATYTDDQYFQPLTQNMGVPEIKRVAKRLAGAKSLPQEKVREMLKSAWQRVKEPDPELKQAALDSLSAESDPDGWLRSMSAEKGSTQFLGWFFAYLTPREFVQGPVKTWLLRMDEKRRAVLLQMISRTTSTHPSNTSEFAKELRQFQLDFIISKDHPRDIRRQVYDYTSYPETPELQKKYVQFSLESFRELIQQPDTDGSSLVHYLVLNLPEDSRDFAEVLEVGCRRGWVSTDPFQTRKTVRQAGVAAAIRTLKEPELPEGVLNRLLNFVEELGTPGEKTALGSLIASLPSGEHSQWAVRICHDAILALPEALREAAWKTYLADFNNAPDRLKAEMASPLVGAEGSHVLEMMTKASDSPNAEARQAALQHWTTASQVAPGVRTSMFAKGLKDPVEANQLAAVNGLT